MTSTPAPTWWEEHDAHLRDLSADPTAQREDAAPPFSDALLALLAEVDTAFSRTSADSPGWPDPHLGPGGEDRDSLAEEYSRCLDPGKYRILWSRAEAWAEVLTARGWATRDDLATGDLRSGVRWATAPPLPLHRTTVLRPGRPGAHLLVLARTAPDGAAGSIDLVGADATILGLLIGIGDPALPISTVPDCGCDACDTGSRDLLERLDEVILSIVDGSFEVALTPGVERQRTSFGSTLSSGDERVTVSAQLTAGPWADGWTPRPLSPPITPSPAVDLRWRRRRNGAEITCTALPESER